MKSGRKMNTASARLSIERVVLGSTSHLCLWSPVAIWTESWFEPSDLKIFTSSPSRTSMGARWSQKQIEADKRIKKALNELLNSQFQSVHEVARANAVSHSTLLRCMAGGKSTAESREAEQILTIPEENALAEWITRLAILGHLPKHAFIQELGEEIRSNRATHNDSSDPIFHISIGNSWVQRFIYWHPELETACSHSIEAARIRDVTKEELDLSWVDGLRGSRCPNISIWTSFIGAATASPNSLAINSKLTFLSLSLIYQLHLDDSRRWSIHLISFLYNHPLTGSMVWWIWEDDRGEKYLGWGYV